MKKKAIKGNSATVVETPKKGKKSTTVIAAKAPEVAELPKKKKKVIIKPDAKLDEANAVSVTKKAITEKKDLKYVYPTEADDIPKRKKFRAEVRRKVRAMEKELYKLQASKNKEDQELYEKKQKSFDKYCGKVYTMA